jgi:hypothetical protein
LEGIQLSCFGRRRVFIIIGVMLLLVASAWPLSVSCDDEELIQPVKVDDHFERSGVEFHVYLFVEPLRELESSSLQMSCGIASVPAELWKLEVHVPRQMDFPVVLEPEGHIRNIVLLTGNRSYETSKPSVFYWILGVEASSGTAGKKVMVNYNLTIDLVYANMSEVEFSLVTEPKSVHILPGESTFPSEILHPLLASIGLAFMLPIAAYFANSKRRKVIRRRIMVGSITLLLAGILFHTSLSAVDSSPELKTPFLASYQIIILADVYQNDTYIPVSSSRTYVWLEEKLNFTSAIIGEVRLDVPPRFTFKEVNFDQLKSNSSDGWMVWWVPPTVSLGDAVNVLNRSLIVGGHDDYFALSALRRTIRLSYEDEEVSVRAQYDAASGFLFRLMIGDKQAETFDLYLFQSILGVKLSIGWTYYAIFFLTMVAAPTLLVLSLTWPKTRRRIST